MRTQGPMGSTGRNMEQDFGELSQRQQYGVPAVPYHKHTGVDSPNICRLALSPAQDTTPSSNILFIGGYRIFTELGSGLEWGSGVMTTGKLAQNTAVLGVVEPLSLLSSGSGTPTFAAAKGTLYINTTATTTTSRLWINTDGSTGWTYFTSNA